jgi:hypothetical protein
MSFSRVWTLVLLGCLAAAAQDSKPNFSGSWQLKEPSKTATAMTMVIDQNGNSIHVVKKVTGADGKESKLEFNCKTDGKECEAAGAKISLWFDGQALVEMDAGDAVSKITMKLDGGALKVDVTHIFPDAEAETFVLAKI